MQFAVRVGLNGRSANDLKIQVFGIVSIPRAQQGKARKKYGQYQYDQNAGTVFGHSYNLETRFRLSIKRGSKFHYGQMAHWYKPDGNFA